MSAAATYYIVGLGNSGDKYTQTRHNIGWRLLDAWRDRHGVSAPHQSAQYSGEVSAGVVHDTAVLVLYPSTYMNHSGSAVRKLVPADQLAQLVVVYDDVDIPFGEIKVSVGGGAAGHNGVRSVTDALGSPNYIRLRIGIAPRHLITRRPVRPTGSALPKYVLQPFSAREERQLPALFAHASDALDTILSDGVTVAMNRYNERTPASGGQK